MWIKISRLNRDKTRHDPLVQFKVGLEVKIHPPSTPNSPSVCPVNKNTFHGAWWVIRFVRLVCLLCLILKNGEGRTDNMRENKWSPLYVNVGRPSGSKFQGDVSKCSLHIGIFKAIVIFVWNFNYVARTLKNFLHCKFFQVQKIGSFSFCFTYKCNH